MRQNPAGRMLRSSARRAVGSGGFAEGTGFPPNRKKGGREMSHEEYMRRALELAKRGEGHVSPNPMVGCVIVKDGRVISEGYHEKVGEYHAERNALLRCEEDPAGADLYVTLEPCCHYGRTPPCTEIIIEKGIGRVFVASMDVNPLVAGKGVQTLRDAGIEVTTGILEQEAMDLNEVFYHFFETRRPFVAMKYAMTLDGKIACHTGDSQWITGPKAREYVHGLRKKYSSILVGITTALKDDPMLNCRTEEGVDPVRLVADSQLRLPTDSQLAQTAKDIPTWVFTTEETLQTAKGRERADALNRLGVDVIPCGYAGTTDHHSRIDISHLLDILAERDIDSVLVEGGGTVNASFLEAGLVDRVYAFLGPKLVGGADSRSPIEGNGVATMEDSAELEHIEVERFENDILITGRVKKGGASCSQD